MYPIHRLKIHQIDIGKPYGSFRESRSYLKWDFRSPYCCFGSVKSFLRQREQKGETLLRL